MGVWQPHHGGWHNHHAISLQPNCTLQFRDVVCWCTVLSRLLRCERGYVKHMWYTHLNGGKAISSGKRHILNSSSPIMAHAQAFMLPAQQGSDASMGAISQRSDSMGSMRSEDSCDNQSGACYDHLEHHSPTSLLPEHPFSPPVLKVDSLPPQPGIHYLSHQQWVLVAPIRSCFASTCAAQPRAR